jgi:hypothetical protein
MTAAAATLRRLVGPTRVGELLLPTLVLLVSRGSASAASFSTLLELPLPESPQPQPEPPSCLSSGTRVTAADPSKAGNP